MVDKVIFAAAGSTEWETPELLYGVLNREFNFNLDAASSRQNAKAENFYTKKEDALNRPWNVPLWRLLGQEVRRPGRVFCNPPYGTGERACPPPPGKCKKKRCQKRGYHIQEDVPGVDQWVGKAFKEVEAGNAELVVMLLPARTCTRWFHKYIWDPLKRCTRPGVELRFLQGRVRFEVAGQPMDPAAFPSMIVIFRKEIAG